MNDRQSSLALPTAESRRMKIAVVGSGVSGLSAAYFLARRHNVVLLEQNARPGGHAHTVSVDTPDGQLSIDTAFVVLNRITYPNLYAFLDELSVGCQDMKMGLGVSVADGRIEYSSPRPFAQGSLLFSTEHLGMLLSVLRFNRQVKGLLADDRLPDITLGEFLERNSYPMSLRVRYIAAVVGPIWTVSPSGAMEIPFPTFARFFQSHGLLNIINRPQWQTITGGCRTYVNATLKKFQGQLRLDAPVVRLQRDATGVMVTTRSGEEHFDAVVCATHTDQALSMLADANPAERSLLSDIQYTGSSIYLHTDENQMPRRRRAWSSWNTLLTEDALSDHPIGITYWMNRVQRLATQTQYFLSINPPRPLRAGSVVYETQYEHPHYSAAAIAEQKRLSAIQGRNRIWWAGAWTGYGFHEDGLKSGLRAVAEIDRACLPAWATGVYPTDKDDPADAISGLGMEMPALGEKPEAAAR